MHSLSTARVMKISSTLPGQRSRHGESLAAAALFRPLCSGYLHASCPSLQITAALRFDDFRNGDASRTDRTLATGAVSRTDFPTTTDTSLSPKLAILYRVTDTCHYVGQRIMPSGRQP